MQIYSTYEGSGKGNGVNVSLFQNLINVVSTKSQILNFHNLEHGQDWSTTG